MQEAERLVRRLLALDLKAFCAKADAQEPQESRIIVDEQDFALSLWPFRNHHRIILHLLANVKEKRKGALILQIADLSKA